MQRTTVFFANVLLVGAITGCGDYEDGAQGEAGPQGEEGPAGDPAERTVHHATFSSVEDMDDGVLEDRELSFTKIEESTMVRLTYYDSFTVNGSGTLGLYGCRWALLFNGAPCTDPGPIAANVTTMGSTISTTDISGWCAETDDGPLGAQEIVVTVQVGPLPASVSGVTDGDCMTGLGTITGFLEAEELAE
jgi:hypothetical protein